MPILQIRRSKKKLITSFSRSLVIITIYLLIGYFVYHTIMGDRGVISYMRLTNEKQLKLKELKELEQKRNKIEHKISLVNKNNIDLDMLDELARSKLGLAEKNDIVIILEDENG